jgi:hypothetical protein
MVSHSQDGRNGGPSAMQQQPFTWSDFESLMQNFQSQMFRLETRPRYNVPWDDQMLPQYLAGRDMPDREDDRWVKWFSDIKRLSENGRDVVRVRLVPAETEKGTYLDYEIRWSYLRYNIPNGERVLALRYDDVPGSLNEDFFVFDDATVVVVRYNEDDSFKGLERETDPAVTGRLLALKKALLEKATPLKEYLGLTS